MSIIVRIIPPPPTNIPKIGPRSCTKLKAPPATAIRIVNGRNIAVMIRLIMFSIAKIVPCQGRATTGVFVEGVTLVDDLESFVLPIKL